VLGGFKGVTSIFMVVLFDWIDAYFLNWNGMGGLKLISIMYLGVLFLFEGE